MDLRQVRKVKVWQSEVRPFWNVSVVLTSKSGKEEVAHMASFLGYEQAKQWADGIRVRRA
jgi:hypothetical protein